MYKGRQCGEDTPQTGSKEEKKETTQEKEICGNRTTRVLCGGIGRTGRTLQEYAKTATTRSSVRGGGKAEVELERCESGLLALLRDAIELEARARRWGRREGQSGEERDAR